MPREHQKNAAEYIENESYVYALPMDSTVNSPESLRDSATRSTTVDGNASLMHQRRQEM